MLEYLFQNKYNKLSIQTLSIKLEHLDRNLDPDAGRTTFLSCDIVQRSSEKDQPTPPSPIPEVEDTRVQISGGAIDNNKSQGVVRSDAKEHDSVRSLLSNDNSCEAISKLERSLKVGEGTLGG